MGARGEAMLTAVPSLVLDTMKKRKRKKVPVLLE